MRTLALLFAPLALAACNQSATAPDAGGSAEPSSAVATTNATVEPVPTETAAPGATPSVSQPPTGSTTPSPATAPSTACGADKAGKFVGRIATPEVRAQVIEAVGHNRLRWIGPDTAVTMDFSESRLNADLDATNRIKGFRCG